MHWVPVHSVFLLGRAALPCLPKQADIAAMGAVGAPPLRNADGRPILCAFELKKRELKLPRLDQAQLRVSWPDLASAFGDTTELFVLDQSGTPHSIKAHVSVKTRGEARREFYLSGVGEPPPPLAAACFGPVLRT